MCCLNCARRATPRDTKEGLKSESARMKTAKRKYLNGAIGAGMSYQNLSVRLLLLLLQGRAGGGGWGGPATD